MFKKLSFVIMFAIISLGATSFVLAESKTEKDSRQAEKIKVGIQKLGTGRDALVEVKLKDKTKVRGFIKESNETGFTVVDMKNGAETIVPYPAAKQVRGNNLSTGAKVAIGLGILAAVLTILLIFENYG